VWQGSLPRPSDWQIFVFTQYIKEYKSEFVTPLIVPEQKSRICMMSLRKN
jgi:hypothetical protein